MSRHTKSSSAGFATTLCVIRSLYDSLTLQDEDEVVEENAFTALMGPKVRIGTKLPFILQVNAVSACCNPLTFSTLATHALLLGTS